METSHETQSGRGHLAARHTTNVVAGVRQSGVVPRLSRHPATQVRLPPRPGEHTEEVIGQWLSATHDN